MKTNITILTLLALSLASCGTTSVYLQEEKIAESTGDIPSRTNNQLACEANAGNSVQVELPQNPGIAALYRSQPLFLCDGRSVFAETLCVYEYCDITFRMYLDYNLIADDYTDSHFDRYIIHPVRPTALVEVLNPNDPNGATLQLTAFVYDESDGLIDSYVFGTQTIPTQDCGCF